MKDFGFGGEMMGSSTHTHTHDKIRKYYYYLGIYVKQLIARWFKHNLVHIKCMYTLYNIYSDFNSWNVNKY